MKVAKFKVCFETDCIIPVSETTKEGQIFRLSDFDYQVIESINEEWRWLKNEDITLKVLEVKEVEE